MYAENKRNSKALRLKQSLYGLKDADRFWNKFLFRELDNIGLREYRAAQCIFTRKNMIGVCHVHDLIVFAKK